MLSVENAFGFCADPSLPVWKNVENYICQMTPTEFYGSPYNSTFHNLCKKTPIPPGTRSLMGKGLKFCPTRPRPTNNVNKSLKRFRNDLRRMAFFYFNPPRKKPGIHYIPGLYLKSKWTAPLAYRRIEKCISNFQNEYRRRCLSFQKERSLTNLTPRQWGAISQLKNNDDVMAVETDKNQGTALVPVPVYASAGIAEHLGNAQVYQRLSNLESVCHEKLLRQKIISFIGKWKFRLQPAEYTFLERALEQTKGRIAKFRMTIKVHKKPWKTRPIVCCVGTLGNYLSRWLDYWFQKLRPFVSSYIKNSAQLLAKLKRLQRRGRLPPDVWLFTADARSMYTNIDTEHALEVIGKWLDKLYREGKLPRDFPLEAVKEAMAIVMRNNTFEWGDLRFLQLIGTAMGTSAACMWATIYFGVHESTTLMPKFGRHLLLFCRFIDDIFGIWIGNPSGLYFNQLIEYTNNFGLLKWDFSTPSKSVDFLDLTIYIEDGRLLTKTYQKPMNLYQYISPSSNHPPKMIAGILYSLLRTYKLQNSREEDYLDVACRLHQRHVARGWDCALLKRLILEADYKLRLEPPTLPSPVTPPSPDPALLENSPRDRIFFHAEYGRNDLSRRAIRSIFDDTCREMCESIGITQFTVAFSRPKNIKDYVTKAKLHMAPGKEASKYYTGELLAEREV